MRRIDRWVGFVLGALAAAVIWSSRAFPAVPGQKLGAGFLPGLVGVGLAVCAVALVRRSFRASAYEPAAEPDDSAPSRVAAPLVAAAAVLGYIALADGLGFLIVVPVALAALFIAFGVRLRPALLWALGGTMIVHLVFYKLLRVPLPWGVLRPFY